MSSTLFLELSDRRSLSAGDDFKEPEWVHELSELRDEPAHAVGPRRAGPSGVNRHAGAALRASRDEPVEPVVHEEPELEGEYEYTFEDIAAKQAQVDLPEPDAEGPDREGVPVPAHLDLLDPDAEGPDRHADEGVPVPLPPQLPQSSSSSTTDNGRIDWAHYDSYVRRMPGKRWNQVVLPASGGRPERHIGELQVLGGSRYQIVAKCFQDHGNKCTRMRAWRMRSEEPAHLERVLVKWLVLGAAKDFSGHQSLSKD